MKFKLFDNMSITDIENDINEFFEKEDITQENIIKILQTQTPNEWGRNLVITIFYEV